MNLEALPRITDAHALPGHTARLTLEDGTARTISSTQPRAYFLPLPGTLGGVFAEDWKDPAAPVYHVPAVTVPAFLAALAFPFTVHGVRLDADHAVLTCDRARHVYEVAVPTPAAYTLIGRRSEAMNSGTPYRLTFAAQPFQTFEVPGDLWPALMPVLTGKDETSAPVSRLLSVEALPGLALRLTLTTGQTLTVSPSAMPRASFHPVTPSGVAVFLEDWKDPTACILTVPRPEDAAALARLFDQTAGGKP